MKRAVNRLLARLAMFVIAIVLGAIAVSQAQKGMEARRAGSDAAATPAVADAQPAATEPVQPIPFAEFNEGSAPPAATFANQPSSTVEMPPIENHYDTAPPLDEPLAYAAPPATLAAERNYSANTYTAGPDYGTDAAYEPNGATGGDYSEPDYAQSDFAEPDFGEPAATPAYAAAEYGDTDEGTGQGEGELAALTENGAARPRYDDYAESPAEAEYAPRAMQLPDSRRQVLVTRLCDGFLRARTFGAARRQSVVVLA